MSCRPFKKARVADLLLQLLGICKPHPLPVPPDVEPVDPAPAARDQTEADELHKMAERQANIAAGVVEDLRLTNIRNGFAPAIERTVVRRIQGRSA
jgi:hypothetical protein